MVDDLRSARALGGAGSINPLAGHHVVTADPRELAASERAGDRSWAAWTYYTRRYGDRGRQFTRSDSAWIVTLAGQPAAVVERQIRWLGALLAARGMPRLLLEEHLRLLHAELVAAVPERDSDYKVLLEVADSLRRERFAALPARVFAEIETSFRVPDQDDLRAGALIAGAVADEQAGVPQAVESLVAWLADPERFSAAWVAAVEQTVDDARHQAIRGLS